MRENNNNTMNIIRLWMCQGYLMCFVLHMGGTINSTACFGADGLPCTTHMLSCTGPRVIRILTTSYGYREVCNDKIGKSNCEDDKCCREEPLDCFELFSDDDTLKVHDACNSHQTCRYYHGGRLRTVLCSGHTISAYSKIHYECVSNDSFPSLNTGRPDILQPDIKTSYDTNIVWIIISAVVVLVIMIIVTVVIYTIRHKQSIKSQEYNNTILSTRGSYTPHYTVVDDASIIDRNNVGEYEDVELEDQYSTTDNFNSNEDKSLQSAKIQSNHIRKLSSETPTNYNHITPNNTVNFQVEDRNNYDHINDVEHPVGDVDNYNHICHHDKHKITIDNDNYNHISVQGI